MSRRALLIALIVSVAVNLFVLGGLAGAALMGIDRHHRPGPSGPPRLSGMGEVLAPEHREGWQAAVRSGAGAAIPQLREARALRRQGWRAIAADPADPQAVQATLQRSRLLEAQARGTMDQAVIAFAATLPADERAKLAEALSRRRPHPSHHRGWSGRGPGADRGSLPDR